MPTLTCRYCPLVLRLSEDDLSGRIGALSPIYLGGLGRLAFSVEAFPIKRSIASPWTSSSPRGSRLEVRSNIQAYARHAHEMGADRI